MSLMHRQIMARRGLPPPGISKLPTNSQSNRNANRNDFTPLSWKSYFDEARDIPVGEDVIRVYLSGFSSEEDAQLTLVLLHGGGYSALTWSLFTRCIRSLVHCRVLAIDLRGHGDSHTQDDYDLSVPTLVKDISRVIETLNADSSSLVLVGHSMGGAIAVHCASHLQESSPNIVGVVVIDVVEGTAMDALASMQSFLRGRPNKFRSVQHAIEWCYRSGQTKNLESARVSMPGQVKNVTTNKTAVAEAEDPELAGDGGNCFEIIDEPKKSNLDAIEEDESPDKEASKMAPPSEDTNQGNAAANYCWRIDLTKTEQHWSGWFTGLSSMFLNCHANAKLLILAGIDRLDNTLLVGQMQGKFQMIVLPKCGHTVHEDVPDKVAETIASFLTRNKFTTAKDDFEIPFPAC